MLGSNALGVSPWCFRFAPKGRMQSEKLNRFSFTFLDDLVYDVVQPRMPRTTYRVVTPSMKRERQFKTLVALLEAGDQEAAAILLSSAAETEQSLLDPSGPMLMRAIDMRLNAVSMAILGLMPVHCLTLTDSNGQNVLHALAPAWKDFNPLFFPKWAGPTAPATGGGHVTQAVVDAMPAEGFAQMSSSGMLPLHCFLDVLANSCPPAAHVCASEVLRKTPPELLAERDHTGANLLHYAASSYTAFPELSRLIELLSESALSERDCHGCTPLHIAARDGGHESSLRFTEVTPSSVLFMANDEGLCPLELALKGCRPRDELSNQLNQDRLEAIIERTLEDSSAVESYAWRAISPLHLMWTFTPHRARQMASKLLLASPFARDWIRLSDPESGLLLIHFAFSRAQDIPALLELIELCPREHLTTPYPITGETLLHLAAHYGEDKADVVAALLARLPPSAFDQRDNKGRTPLMIAIECSQRQIVERMCDVYTGDCPLTVEEWRQLRAGLDVGACLALVMCYSPAYLSSTEPEQWTGGQTPLHGVCSFWGTCVDSDWLRELVRLCPPWFATVLNWRGRTPVHEALHTGNLDVLKVLLESGQGEIAALVPMAGHRPLEIAVRTSNLEAAQLLISVAPDTVNLPTKAGGTLVEFLDRIAETHEEDELALVYAMRRLLQPPPKSAWE